jgi:hypothetical protein
MAEIAFFGKTRRIIARQVHVDNTSRFDDLGLLGRIRPGSNLGFFLPYQFIDKGTFAGTGLPKKANPNFLFLFFLPGFQKTKSKFTIDIMGNLGGRGSWFDRVRAKRGSLFLMERTCKTARKVHQICFSKLGKLHLSTVLCVLWAPGPMGCSKLG